MTDKPVSFDESSERTSSSLLDRARLNDQTAWKRLVDLYAPLVYRWCRQSGLQPSDAENIGQDVFSKVAKGLSGFRHDDSTHTFRGWIRIITRNTIMNHFKADRVGASRLPEDDNLADEKSEGRSKTVSEETSLLYQKAVELIESEFSDVDFQAFKRVVVNEQPAKLVAEELGVSVNVVYLAKSRITKRVREEFRDLIAPAECGAATLRVGL